MEYGRESAVPLLDAVAAVPGEIEPGVAVMSYCSPEIIPAPTALVAAPAAVEPGAAVSIGCYTS